MPPLVLKGGMFFLLFRWMWLLQIMGSGWQRGPLPVYGFGWPTGDFLSLGWVGIGVSSVFLFLLYGVIFSWQVFNYIVRSA